MRDDGTYRRARDVADDAAEDLPRLHPAAGGSIHRGSMRRSSLSGTTDESATTQRPRVRRSGAALERRVGRDAGGPGPAAPLGH